MRYKYLHKSFQIVFLVRGDNKMLLRHRLYDDFLILTDGENENCHSSPLFLRYIFNTFRQCFANVKTISYSNVDMRNIFFIWLHQK